MEKAGDILKEILKDKMYREAVTFSSFFRGWDMIVGDPLSLHSKVIDIQNNALLIIVDHPGWLQLLHMKKRNILKRIKKLYPEFTIKDLRVRVGCFLKENTIEKVKSDKHDTQFKKDFKDNKNQELSDIGDNEMREILKKLSKSIGRRQNGK